MIDITIGTDLNEWLGEGYDGELPGMKCVIVDDEVPEGNLVFISAGIVIHVARKGDDFETMPKANTYDGVVCHPNDSPDAVMGKPWTTWAADRARKALS